MGPEDELIRQRELCNHVHRYCAPYANAQLQSLILLCSDWETLVMNSRGGWSFTSRLSCSAGHLLSLSLSLVAGFPSVHHS